ncbi:MAG: hypothetical protein KME27_26860 [Lyngbya sp. HA4199-MV5]|jgi:hypothetical protein|nr:hypothetical protein [Lyngbya sp. HA4199-MV5]
MKTILPNRSSSQPTLIQYTVKRPWKIDGRLLRRLKADNAEEVPLFQTRGTRKYQFNLISEIKSVSDLEVALTEIVRELTLHKPKQFVTIAALSEKFCAYYKQPIKVVMRNVCPDMKLIELLQTMPGLCVQNVDNDWQIRLEADSVE